MEVAQLQAPCANLYCTIRLLLGLSNFPTPDNNVKRPSLTHLQNLVAHNPLNPAQTFSNASAKQERSNESPLAATRNSDSYIADPRSQIPKPSRRTSHQTLPTLLYRFIDHTPSNTAALPTLQLPSARGKYLHTFTHTTEAYFLVSVILFLVH